jgi:hypothetical protein
MKIKILLKEIYKHKKEELKVLRMTFYTKENKNESILRI